MMRQSGDDSVVEVATTDCVMVVTISDERSRNAYSYELEHQLHAALRSAELAPEIRAVVLTARGKTFCPGFAADVLHAAVDDGIDRTARSSLPFHLATSTSMPVVCAINGACAGVGLVLALTCDLRLAAHGARFSTAFARVGLPAERGISWLLPRVVGHARALDLLLTARVVNADEALDLGLVNGLSEPSRLVDEAVTLARQVARNCSPAALAAIKSQVYDDWTLDLAGSAARADERLSELVDGPDFRAAMSARVHRSNGNQSEE